MNISNCILSVLAIILLYGCGGGQGAMGYGGRGTEIIHTANLTGPQITQVEMERSGCYGSCPVYQVIISSEGRVSFEGTQYVAVPGVHQGMAVETDVRALIAEIQRIQFFALRNTYESEADGCATRVKDHPSVSITVKRADRTKRVRYDYGCTGFKAEKSIRSLAERIDRVAQVDRWVRARDRTF